MLCSTYICAMIFDSGPDFQPKLAEPLSERSAMDGQFGMFTFDRRYVKSEHFEQASFGPSVPMNEGSGSLHLPIASIQRCWLDGLRTVDWDGMSIY